LNALRITGLKKKPIVMGKKPKDYIVFGQFISMGLILVPAQDDHVK
jgi:hypothetical protein